jgi:DNA-binding transcriptional MerR regulator
MIQLENKLYTSTEVADILGVSLRSVYRYIEESKLKPEVKTATGRHRFTKQNILDFLYPEGAEKGSRKIEGVEEAIQEVPIIKTVKKSAVDKKPETVSPVVEVSEEEKEVSIKASKKEEPAFEPISEKVVEEKVTEKEEKTEKEESVDWLSKFREAAKKFEDSSPTKAAPAKEETIFTKEEPRVSKYFYRSKLGGLKDIAQNIDKTSKNSGLDYAFTMSAGLSLHSPIKPFSLLHAYVRSKDKDFFERVLMLTPSDAENGQLGLILSDDNKIYNTSIQMHGLTVVSKERLLSDIREMDTEGNLVKEAEGILG